MRILKTVINFIINILFPPVCVFCERMLEPNVRRHVCRCCEKELPYCRNKPCCIKCGKPLVGFGRKQLCTFCMEPRSKYFNRIASVFEYTGSVKDAILRYKLTHIRSYARVFSEYMYQRMLEEYHDISFDFICSAPSHKNHSRQHGFDHSAELCRRLSKLADIKCAKGLLIKHRITPRQSSLRYHDRLANLTGSVRVNERLSVEGKTVLLVDDIATTRSTVIECSRALKEAGARKVFVITLSTTVKS